ncbi:MAG: hypothetical protein II551_04930, partial [Paludibacteraceae bacterium]|nr:hypothetical protein [Paludibacteraceae bacterium]
VPPARTFAFPIRKRTFLIEYIPPIRKDKKGGQEKGTEGSPIYGRYKGGKCSRDCPCMVDARKETIEGQHAD